MEGQLYASLGLSEAASPQDIKQAYRRLCWELHPDLDLSNADSFQSVTLAYKTLSDPSQRAAYDGHLLNEEQLKSCLAQLKTEARLQASYMTFSVAAVREREAASGGLVILKALYGALYFRGDPAASPSSYAGKILDVTIPLQCCVYNSELILFEKDKSALDGIYDPDEALPEHLKELYILYSFNGWTYEVTQCASDVVALPDPSKRSAVLPFLTCNRPQCC